MRFHWRSTDVLIAGECPVPPGQETRRRGNEAFPVCESHEVQGMRLFRGRISTRSRNARAEKSRRSNNPHGSRLKVLPRSSPPLSRRVGGRMGERGWGREGSERRIGLRSARTVGVEAVSGSIPQYRSGQFGRGARCHPLRLRLRVSIPQDQSGQFGPGGIMWQVIWNFWKSQYRSGQFGRQHRRNVPGPEHRVSIPQYRSGQFGQPPSQSQPFQDLTRPFRVTSQNHLREPCAFPCREFENRSQQPPFMQVIGSMLPRRQNGPLPLACFLSGTTFAGPYSGPAGWRAIDKSGVQRPLARTVVLLAWIA
jgi:hypothetical protein